MYRCAMPAGPGLHRVSRLRSTVKSLAARIALMTVAAATLGVAALPAPAQAQVATGHRLFPSDALRGEIVFGYAPDVTLNGKSDRLAPGVRIRDTADMLALPGTLIGQKATVQYNRDINGLLINVWILNKVELANKPWPRTTTEASTWIFNRDTQTWTKS
ncbi:hypothetical protein [Roseateles amylovorans]|uniref:Uncharacterized protein n=1 Tax=Roseateles amylovorans TaxID=2978473 RepID=A0ABY6AY85_9BURK|nr:hypothetical protein [Roseateles amylovorans]UXH77755.1 hypothetical protein N4261_22680 [Roseateles amylovorans]